MYDTNSIKCIETIHKLPRLKKNLKTKTTFTSKQNPITATTNLNHHRLRFVRTHNGAAATLTTISNNSSRSYPTRRNHHHRHRHSRNNNNSNNSRRTSTDSNNLSCPCMMLESSSPVITQTRKPHILNKNELELSVSKKRRHHSKRHKGAKEEKGGDGGGKQVRERDDEEMNLLLREDNSSAIVSPVSLKMSDMSMAKLQSHNRQNRNHAKTNENLIIVSIYYFRDKKKDKKTLVGVI